MVLSTGVSPRMGVASCQRFSGYGERRCAYKLRPSAAMVAQMYTQTVGSAVWLGWPRRRGFGLPGQFWSKGFVGDLNVVTRNREIIVEHHGVDKRNVVPVV
jgi:hypothetical protein